MADFILTNRNFHLYAAQHYKHPCIDATEFYSDLARVKYVKRLLRKYWSTGLLQERLTLNHLLILRNMFGCPVSNKMLFFKLEPELWPALKTCLVYLNSLPLDEKIEVPIDLKIAAILRKL